MIIHQRPGDGRIDTAHFTGEEDLSWDLSEPCADCPFRVSGPPERKGILQPLPMIVMTLHKDGNGCIAHTCHRTDPRVTDGGFKEGYTGPVQHCAGFIWMMAKSNVWSGPALRARARGVLRIDKITAAQKRMVYTLKDLYQVMGRWAERELEALDDSDD
jgi:hypothetical protein